MFGGDVAQVTEQVHGFVIAQQHMQPAARRGRLLLQPHQQIHDLPRSGATVQQVAEADHMAGACCPVVLCIDDSRLAQQLVEFRIRAMHVRESQHARHVVPLGLRGRLQRGWWRSRQCGRGGQHHTGQSQNTPQPRHCAVPGGVGTATMLPRSTCFSSAFKRSCTCLISLSVSPICTRPAFWRTPPAGVKLAL